MRIVDVLTRLPEGVEATFRLADPEAAVYTVSFAAPGMVGPLREDVLYFGDAATLSQAEAGGTHANLVVFGPGSDDPSWRGPAAGPDGPELNVVTLADESSVPSCYNALQAIFLEDQAQIGVIRRMMMAHFSNKGIAYLVDEAAKALGNPIDVIDHAYHHIAYSMGPAADGAGRAGAGAGRGGAASTGASRAASSRAAASTGASRVAASRTSSAATGTSATGTSRASSAATGTSAAGSPAGASPDTSPTAGAAGIPPFAPPSPDDVRQVKAALVGDKLSDEQIDYISRERIDSELARTAGPLVRFNHVVGRNTMTLAVMANNVIIGFVMLVELYRPFSASDTECFERFAGFVGQELQKSEMWQPAIGEMGSYFLTNLLGNDSLSEQTALRRAKEFNFHPRDTFYMLCLHAPGEGLEQRQAERCAEHLRPFMGDYLYTRYHRNLVVLYTQDGGGGIDERALHLLRETAALNELSVGVSNPFGQITGARKAYEQARAAVRLGEGWSRRSGAGDVFAYCDFADLHLLEVASRRANPADFVHPALMRLREHDARHGTELMDTLYCFLYSAGSNARAAEMLSLHKNSMLYRMGKIGDLLGLDLASGETRFALMAGFHTLIYLGLFRPRVS